MQLADHGDIAALVTGLPDAAEYQPFDARNCLLTMTPAQCLDQLPDQFLRPKGRERRPHLALAAWRAHRVVDENVLCHRSASSAWIRAQVSRTERTDQRKRITASR